MATINLATLPLVRQESYLEYEYQADLSHDAKVYFNEASLSYEHLVALQAGDKTIKFSLIDAAPTETLIYNNQVVYPDVFPDVDLYYTVDDASLKEEIIITKPTARHDFSFDLQQENVNAYLQQDNSIQYLDAGGNLVWTIQAPYAFDAENKEVQTTLSFTGTLYTLTALPDENTVYPIALDPTATFNLGSHTIFYQNYAGTATYSYGPVRFDVGRLDYTEIISKVYVYCSRRIKSPTGVVTNYFDNANPNNKAWFQWFSQDGTALTVKSDFLGVSTTMELIPPPGAYYLEFSGLCNGTTEADGIWQAFQMVYISKFDYDDAKSCLWSFFTARSVDQIVSSGSLYLNTIDSDSNAGDVIRRAMTTEPGYYFSTGTFSVSNYRLSNIWLSPAYCNCYDAAGTLLSSTPLSVPTSAGMVNTNVTPPVNTSKIELTGTVNVSGTVPTEANARLLGSLTFYIPRSYVTVSMVSKDINNARVAPWFTSLSAWPARIFTSVNDQAHYSETAKVTAAKGDVVYVKLMRQAADTTTGAKIAGISFITIAEQFAAAAICDVKRLITAGQSLLPDTLRSILAGGNASTDSARSTTSNHAIFADTKRTTASHLFIAADTALKTIVPFLLSIGTTRRLSLLENIAASTKRIVKRSLALIADTKRILLGLEWARVKKAEIKLKIQNKAIKIIQFKD